MKTISILIPAHNEAAYLPGCLQALLASDPVEAPVEVIVIANGCADDTATIAQGFKEPVLLNGWVLKVLDIVQGGKLNALNAGEAAAQGDTLIYLDADVVVSPPLLAQLADTLVIDAARYASGQPNVTVGASAVTRHYTRFWRTIPFMTSGVPGFGIFAMNRSGRARWGAWPDIISDDTFARLHFARDERVSVPARYDWPMIEGFAALVRVRRRQDAGVTEIAALYPTLMANEDPKDGAAPLWKRALRDPVAFGVFAAIRSAARLPIFRSDNKWVRGR
jgi:glycosyltransferase involved in cell wall biosynthesis